MSEKPSLLDRLLGSAKNKADENKGVLETEIKQRLKNILYDDELVEELAPVFIQMNGTEGFNQVFDLLETKERQIEAISGGNWFKQETKTDGIKEQEETDSNLVDEYLTQKYKGN